MEQFCLYAVGILDATMRQSEAAWRDRLLTSAEMGITLVVSHPH